MVLQAGDVEEVEAGVAEGLADLVDEAALLRAAEARRRFGDDEAEDRERLLDLEGLAQLGRDSSSVRSTIAGRRMSGLSMPYLRMASS